MNKDVMNKISYGLFVLTAKDGDKHNGCITNTLQQITTSPNRVSIAVNKENLTHDMILKTGEFNVSIISEEASFDMFKHFGFQSGRDVDKFADYPMSVSENGLAYVTTGTNAYISAKVTQTLEFETHTLFIADVTGGEILAEAASATYDYYHKNIKEMPAAQASESGKSSWVCKICGYVHEGDELPADFVCPWCKHGPEDFEKK